MPLSASHHRIDLVGTHLDEDIIRSVQGNGHHPRLNIALPDGVTAYQWSEFPTTQPDQADLIILGVSSAGVDWAIDRLCETLHKPTSVLMITKGLRAEGDEIKAFPEIVSRELNNRLGFRVPVMAVGGPCIAGELAALRDTLVVATGDDGNAVANAMALLDAPFYHARPSADVLGVELCAAFKNFFALGVGWAAGHLEVTEPAANGARMHNPAAGLFAQSLSEMRMLAAGLGGDVATVDGLAGVGDLYVTCLAGRNSRMGRLLGLGLRYSEAKAEHMAADTVEGAELARAIGPQLERMWEAGTLPEERMPLSRAIVAAVCHDRLIELNWNNFIR
jgi:glycerol-3-phosphate dehydrogenase (NAD(P)+)